MQKNTSRISIQRRIGVQVLVIALFSLIPWQSAIADIGDKPTLSFDFIFEEGAQLTITEGTLYQCDDSACADRQPLAELGPQRFSCSETSCSATTYGHPDFMQLEITFSDGITRRSGVFSTSGFHVEFSVTVRESDLLVNEEIAIPSTTFLMLLLGGLAIVGLVILIILLGISIVRSRRGIFDFTQSRWVIILTWVLAIPLIILGSFITLAVPLTVVIEAAIAYFFARSKRFSPLNLITLSLPINAITLTILLIILTAPFLSWDYIPMLILIELIIWFVEAALYKIALDKQFSWRASLGYSAMLNLPTFLLGLFLSIP